MSTTISWWPDRSKEKWLKAWWMQKGRGLLSHYQLNVYQQGKGRCAKSPAEWDGCCRPSRSQSWSCIWCTCPRCNVPGGREVCLVCLSSPPRTSAWCPPEDEREIRGFFTHTSSTTYPVHETVCRFYCYQTFNNDALIVFMLKYWKLDIFSVEIKWLIVNSSWNYWSINVFGISGLKTFTYYVQIFKDITLGSEKLESFHLFLMSQQQYGYQINH